MTSSATIVWFRQDLRLEDNPALVRAAERGGPVIPVYVWAPDEEEAWPPGTAGQWWLSRSLSSLDRELGQSGSRLIIRHGPTLETFQDLATQTGAGAVYWNRRYEPEASLKDSQIELALREQGLDVETFNSALLFEPWEVTKDNGGPYQVFTSFWKRCLSFEKSVEVLPRPQELKAPLDWPHSFSTDVVNSHGGFSPEDPDGRVWMPGSSGAKSGMEEFFHQSLLEYATDRDRPDLLGTSILSPHLHFGELGPRQIWRAIQYEVLKDGSLEDLQGPMVFLKELGWREFANHLLFHFPHTPQRPLRPEYEAFPWRYDAASDFQAWQDGQTGYPLVDAGMRQLLSTGWVHNRVRMVVASFLVKHLLIPWQDGAGWFWDTLLDADLANNTLGWQWSAGCGADATPYFRVFNPVSQGERFDPCGAYVRRWVPELAAMPDNWIHRPWEAPQKTLDRAGIELGRDYPVPIVDHKFARQRALNAFETLKQSMRAAGTRGR